MQNEIEILLVDDDADDRELFVKAIKDINNDIKCSIAKDGKQALDFLKLRYDVLPDLIFLDLRMPRFGGRKCLLEIMNDQKLKNIPVIIYTTSRNVEESVELRELGAVHFTTKPTDPEEIYYVVSFILEQQINLARRK